MFKKLFFNSLPSIIATLLLAGAIVYAAWTGPSQPPPNCPTGEPGCDAPLNVGPAVQTKSGGLNIGGNLEITGTIKIAGGSPGLGKVLISDASGLSRWGGVPGVLYGSCTLVRREHLYQCGGPLPCSNWCADTFNITDPAVQIVSGSDCVPGYKSKWCGCSPSSDYDLTQTGSSQSGNYFYTYYSCKA